MKKSLRCLLVLSLLLVVAGCDEETTREKCAKDCAKLDKSFYSVTTVSKHQSECWCIEGGIREQIW